VRRSRKMARALRFHAASIVPRPPGPDRACRRRNRRCCGPRIRSSSWRIRRPRAGWRSLPRECARRQGLRHLSSRSCSVPEPQPTPPGRAPGTVAPPPPGPAIPASPFSPSARCAASHFASAPTCWWWIETCSHTRRIGTSCAHTRAACVCLTTGEWKRSAPTIAARVRFICSTLRRICKN